MRFYFTPEGFQLENSEKELTIQEKRLEEQFRADRYRALYQVGFSEVPACFDAAGRFLYQTADCFLQELIRQPELELVRGDIRVKPEREALQQLEQALPFAIGSEYVDDLWLDRLWKRLNEVFSEEIAAYQGTVAMYLTEKNQQLRVPERVFFHLVESKDEEYPFAFLATYATRDETGRVRHVPLRYALTEFKNEREKLLTLLACLNRAAEASPLIGSLVESGEMFHTLRLTAKEAYEILKSIPKIEAAGILCRIPNWWKRRSASVTMTVSLGDEEPPMLGFDTLLSVRPKLTVDGVELSQEDIEKLLAQTEGLAMLKGKWIEIDHERLQRLLEQMEGYHGEETFLSALRQGTMDLSAREDKDGADLGVRIQNGVWFSRMLHNLRTPSDIRSVMLPRGFQATLRPYQKTGYTWLNYMNRLGFGACLADDMGLGKTVQVLAFLERLRTTVKGSRALLVVPASLLGNWKRETEKFAPKMDLQILHGKPVEELGKSFSDDPAFLTVTTYGMVSRIPELEAVDWDCVILDEAQAIKNPMTKQTRQIKKLRGRMRIAMTGTPIENDLTNLWSLFDFLDKGLLGSSAEFKEFCKGIASRPDGYARLKGIVSPFMLRRVKSDKRIISDLPEKWEKNDYVELSKRQIVLYRKLISELEEQLTEAEGIARRGLVLSAIVKFKQICNHPDQYLGQEAYAPADSGKFQMLRDICETIYEKRDRVLVFTQFKEITGYLNAYLAEIFHHKGFVLHGGTPAAKRTQIVEAFQGEDYVPYIVLSVKAGGTGLNLTKASHVIHFDRWWNPAVENQATDRAYRIGQTNNVMVHKLVCSGTIEEKIDAMIASKKNLSEQVIGSGGEKWITDMSNEELMSVLRLEV